MGDHHIPLFGLDFATEDGDFEIVHVPKVFPQERIIQQTGVQLVEVPVPMTQEEVILERYEFEVQKVARCGPSPTASLRRSPSPATSLMSGRCTWSSSAET